MVEQASDLVKWQDAVDTAFIQRVQAEVTQSCALPFALPIERIPEYILQAAQWFWLNCDWASVEKLLAIKNADICKCGNLNKTITLPPQILAVHGVFKVNDQLAYGAMGDFSIERMMMSTYTMFGGVGTVGGGFTGTAGMAGFNLTDVITSMYEIDTFNQNLNPPLSYDFDINSHKLILLGNLGGSDLLINCFQRCKIQDLYNNYYFFRLVVCFAKRALSSIYGTFSFKYPGGIEVNISDIKDEAKEEIDEIKEWVESHNGVSYFFQPNTL